MESSTSSLTFKGSIPEAIIEAQKKRKLFVVYISGEDANSVLLERTAWVDLNAAESISRHCVFLHLVHGSVDASHFSAIYPQKSVPSISAIGYNGGKLLWQHEGYVNAEKLVADIQKACTSLHLQETTATVLTAAALASKNPELRRFNATNIASFEQGSSSRTNIPTSSTENSPQGSEAKPLITSEIIGENLTSEPIAEKYSKLDEETTSQPTHVNEWECSNDGHSISTSETSKSSFSPATIDVAESDIETRPLNVGNGSVAPPDGITSNDHNTRNSMGSSGEMPTNHGPEFSQERPQVSVNEVEGSSQEKPDGSASHGNVSDLLSLEKVPAYKLTLMRNSMSAAVHMFKDPDQWSDLNVAIEVLDSAAKMSKINVSLLRDSLLRFHDSVTALKSVESMVIAPEILECGRQLASSKEKISHIASDISGYDQEQQSLQERLKASSDNRIAIQGQITLLKEQISQLEMKDREEELNINKIREEMQVNTRFADLERSEMTKNEGIIASLEKKLADVPDHAKIFLEAKSKHIATHVQLKEDLQRYLVALGMSEDL